MFSKNDKSTPAQSGAPEVQIRNPKRGGVPSIISADLKIVGSLTSDGEVQIDGAVEGDISGQVVTISKGGRVDGAIAAETVHVSGMVTGKIGASSVIIAKQARVIGDVVHQTLAIETGAYLEGFCRPRDAKVAPVEQPVKVPELKPAASPPAMQLTPTRPAVTTNGAPDPAVPRVASGKKG